MALTEKLPRVQYTASGSASFLFNFPIWDSSELEVYVDDELQDSSKYSVSFTAGDESGGTVIFTTAPTSGAIVTIVRRHDQERTSDFSLTGPFSVSALNEQLDRLTAQVQDLQEQVNRSLRYKVTNTESFPYQIPGMEFPSPQASRVIGYGPDGKPSLYTPQSDSSVLTLNAIRQTFTATAGQTVFDNLGFTYTPGSNELTVYVNGVRQTLDQYSETDSTTVTFNSPLAAGDVVEFVLNEWTGQDVSDSQLRTDSVEEVHDNIASLISTTPPTYRKVAFVKGYHTPGDGGGGVFYWDDSEPKSNHNGGTIIDPTQTFPTDWSNTAQQSTWFTAGGSGGGCWKRVYSGVISVKYFGAKGDDAIDDTNALQTAITYGSNNNISVFIPNGIYRISSTLVLPSNTRIVGENKYKTVITAAHSTANLVMRTAYPIETVLTQTEDLTDGSKGMNIANNAQAGDFIRIRSTQRCTRLWDGGSVIRSYYLDGELMKIESATSSRVDFTTELFLDFPVAYADSVVVFTPTKNVSVSHVSLILRSDENAATTGLLLVGVDGFEVKNVYVENSEAAGISASKSMFGIIENVHVKGGHVTLGLNYGVLIYQGTKYVNVKNIHGKQTRHVVAGGNDSWGGCCMYINVENVSGENELSHTMDTHASGMNWHVKNIFGSISCSGIGHVVENVRSNKESCFFAFEGGYRLTFRNIHCTNLVNVNKSQLINNSTFENIYLGFKRPRGTENFAFGEKNMLSNVSIINEAYDSTMTETEADGTLYDGTAFIGFRPYKYTIANNIRIRGFPIGLVIYGKSNTITNVKIEECGWLSTYTSSDTVIQVRANSTENHLSNVLITMNNTVINNNARVLWISYGVTYSTFSNIVCKPTNTYYYSIRIEDNSDYLTLHNIHIDGVIYTGTGTNYRVWKVTGMADT